MAKDSELLGECLGGALYVGDFVSLAKKTGFLDPRRLTSSVLEIQNADIEKKVGAARFGSETYRLFKLDGLDDRCEDYGQIAVYKREIPHLGPLFKLDDHHMFELNRPERICGNTAAMLRDTRFGKHFDIVGDESVHYGLFDCSQTMASAQYAATEPANPRSDRARLLLSRANRPSAERRPVNRLQPNPVQHRP